MKKLIYDYKLRGKIDLIYIDPPFATNEQISKLVINELELLVIAKKMY